MKYSSMPLFGLLQALVVEELF